MTLSGHFALRIVRFDVSRSPRSTTKISMTNTISDEDVSGNIRLMRIFAGVPGKGASNKGGVIENVDFRTFGRYVFGTWGTEANIIISALSSFHLLQNSWPWMTLNGHFTLNFYCYEQHFQNLFYILTVEAIYRIFLLYHVTSRDVRKRTVICRIFGICGRTADLS